MNICDNNECMYVRVYTQFRSRSREIPISESTGKSSSTNCIYLYLNTCKIKGSRHSDCVLSVIPIQ